MFGSHSSKNALQYTTYCTWNPSDKGANIALSNGNLTLTTTSPGGLVRGTVGKSSGKWYWEVTRGAGADMDVGVAKAGASLTSYLGSDANGYGYIGSNGNKISSATSTAYGSSYASGVVIGVALDLDNGTLTFYRNGVSQGVAYSGLSGTFYPAEGTTNNGDTCTANFGATAFAYTPPAGFAAGIFSSSPTLPVTYATWNPSDKGGGVTLSNGNLTVSLSTTPTDGGSVRSTIGKSSGKWYWEVTVGGSQSWSLPGIADATASVASSNVYVFSSGGYGYYTATGTKYNNGGNAAYATGASPGDVIGVALDLTAGTLTFYKNGVSLGTAFSGLSGTFYAAEGNYTLNVTQSTTNFGASPFAYTVPSGFNAGLYV